MPIKNRKLVCNARGVKQAYINVTYHNPHTGKFFNALPLIDTGADCCMLPAKYATLLGHNYIKGEPCNVDGVGGRTTGYKHTIKIQVADFYTAEMMIIFSDCFDEPILGVTTFLSYFKLEIDYPNNIFSLIKPEEGSSMEDWGTP